MPIRFEVGFLRTLLAHASSHDHFFRLNEIALHTFN